ncbi:MAG: CpsB/CapC family capsule biosynthesis tyrosine phosphatase [Halioglobus sp.]
MIDLHCHLLPGIDDGPDTMAQSIELCRLAAADGITHAIVTPHIHPGRWENSKASITKACAELQAALTADDNPLQLGYSGEVRLTDEVMMQVANEQIPFYGEIDGYQIMLLEFPHGHIIPGSDKLVAWLLDRGIRPLIAHPERNKQLMKAPAQLRPFIEMGCWLQVTAGSVTGSFGEPAKHLAKQLLQDDVVTVIASDGHNAKARPPTLKQAFDHIAENYGDERASRLMLHTPAAIIAGQFEQQAVAS